MKDTFLQRLHQPEPLNIAHRGACRHAPENTLAAFERAIEHGADGIELDVRLCRSKDWVVCHDSRLNRTTNGNGYIRTKYLHEIRAFDAGVKFGEEFRSQVIPTLSEVLELAHGRALLNIEIKAMSAVREPVLANLVNLLYRHRAEHRCLISSFNPIVLRRLGRLDSSLPLGLLLSGKMLSRNAGLPLRKLTGVHALHLHTVAIDPVFIERIRALGLYVMVWGANCQTSLRRLVDMGVDGIITDEPLELSRILGRKVAA